MTDSGGQIAEIAHRFLDAVESGDIVALRSLYADDAVIWHNITQATIGVADNIATLERFAALASSRRYTERRLSVFGGGFVEQHVLIAERVDGRVLHLPACLVCAVADGRITRLDEYFDDAPVRAWLA